MIRFFLLTYMNRLILQVVNRFIVDMLDPHIWKEYGIQHSQCKYDRWPTVHEAHWSVYIWSLSFGCHLPASYRKHLFVTVSWSNKSVNINTHTACSRLVVLCCVCYASVKVVRVNVSHVCFKVNRSIYIWRIARVWKSPSAQPKTCVWIG